MLELMPARRVFRYRDVQGRAAQTVTEIIYPDVAALVNLCAIDGRDALSPLGQRRQPPGDWRRICVDLFSYHVDCYYFSQCNETARLVRHLSDGNASGTDR